MNTNDFEKRCSRQLRVCVGIRILCPKIRQELHLVYGFTVASEEKVRQRCRHFKSEHTNVHHEERSGRSSIQTETVQKWAKNTIRPTIIE